VPKAVLVRPVAAEAVGAALADVVESGPSGRARDVAGPEVLTIDQAAKAWKTATHRRQPLVGLRVPGTVGRRLRAGAFVPADALVDGPSYVQWLAAQPTATQPAP
jgi:hypothetical protein